MSYLLLFVSIGFGIARFTLPAAGTVNHADIFKDMAHLFVGFMFGYAVYGLRDCSKNGNNSTFGCYTCDGALALYMAVGLTVLEVVAFFVRKSL